MGGGGGGRISEQISCILAQCSGFWLIFIYLFYQMQNFCILAQCSGFRLIFIHLTKCRISASQLSAVDFG